MTTKISIRVNAFFHRYPIILYGWLLDRRVERPIPQFQPVAIPLAIGIPLRFSLKCVDF